MAQADDLHAAQGTGGEAGGRKGRGTPPPRAFAAGPPPGEKQEWSGYLGKDTWVGEGKESLKVGVPDPDPPTLSRQKGAKGLGRRDRRHRQRRRDCGQGTRPVLTSGLIIQKPCRENKRKCKREGREKKKEKKK